MRIYVLVTSLGSAAGDPLVAFFAEEGLVRLCTEDYCLPDKKNMGDLLSHLTNYSLNKLSDKFKYTPDLEHDDGSKRTLSQVLKMLNIREGINVANLLEQMKEVCLKTLVALQPFALRDQELQFGSAFDQALGDCY